MGMLLVVKPRLDPSFLLINSLLHFFSKDNLKTNIINKKG